MYVANGYFDSDGTPRLHVELRGSAPNGISIDAIVDTGFSGFLCIPAVHAVPAGLKLLGTTTVFLADGSQGTRRTSNGSLTLNDRSAEGIIILEQGEEIEPLLGMDFLRRMKISIVMSKALFFLFDENWIEQASSAATGPHQPQPTAPPSAGNATAQS